jgi:hypothetical protein
LPTLTALESPRSKRSCGQTNRLEGSVPQHLSRYRPTLSLRRLESSVHGFLCLHDCPAALSGFSLSGRIPRSKKNRRPVHEVRVGD